MAVKMFSGRATIYLSEKIANAYGETLGEVDYQQFSDGEMSPFLAESVRGHEVFLIQSTFAPSDNLMELLLMIDAAKRASASSINVGFHTLVMRVRIEKTAGVAIAAKLIANLISAGVQRASWPVIFTPIKSRDSLTFRLTTLTDLTFLFPT